jgi:hypothetical protein
LVIASTLLDQNIDLILPEWELVLKRNNPDGGLINLDVELNIREWLQVLKFLSNLSFYPHSKHSSNLNNFKQQCIQF